MHKCILSRRKVVLLQTPSVMFIIDVEIDMHLLHIFMAAYELCHQTLKKNVFLPINLQTATKNSTGTLWFFSFLLNNKFE